MIPNVEVVGVRGTASSPRTAWALPILIAFSVPHANEPRKVEEPAKTSFRWIVHSVSPTAVVSTFTWVADVKPFLPKTAMAEKLWALRQQIVSERGTLPARELLANLEEARRSI